MNQNNLEVLLLTLPVNELHLLKVIIEKQPLLKNPVDIEIFAEDYAKFNSDTDTDDFVALDLAAKGLFERKLTYADAVSSITSTLLMRWLSDKHDKKVVLTFSECFFDVLRMVELPALQEMLDVFSKPPVSDIARFYSAKLYLMLTKHNPALDTVVISYAVLREAFNLDDDSYFLTHNFKRRVLNPAIQDINELGLFGLSCVDVTDGRKITDFKFIMTNKPSSKPNH